MSMEITNNKITVGTTGTPLSILNPDGTQATISASLNGDNFDISKNLTVDGNFDLGGNADISSNLIVRKNVDICGNLYIDGNFTVVGQETRLDIITLDVSDNNITLGFTATGDADDTTADGGGVTLKGTSDKTITFDNLNDNWTSSEHWNIKEFKTYKINNIDFYKQGRMDISSSSVSENVVEISANHVRTANVIDVRADALTSGNGIYVESQNASNCEGALAHFHLSNTANKAKVLSLQQNSGHSSSRVIDISSGQVAGKVVSLNAINLTTGTVMDIDADKLTTGHVLDINVNSITTGNVLKARTTSTNNFTLVDIQGFGASGDSTIMNLKNDSQNAGSKALDVSGAVDIVMARDKRNAFTVTANDIDSNNALYVTSSSSVDHTLARFYSSGTTNNITTIRVDNDSADTDALAMDVNGGVTIDQSDDRHGLVVTANDINGRNALNVTSSSTSANTLTTLTSTGATGDVTTLLVQNNSTNIGAIAVDVSGSTIINMVNDQKHALSVTANDIGKDQNKNAVNVTSSSTDAHVLTKLTSSGASGVVNTLQVQNNSTAATANALDISGALDLVMLKSNRNALTVTANDLNDNNAVNVTSSSTEDHVLTKLTSTGTSGVVKTLQVQNDSTDATANALDITGGVDFVMSNTTRNAFNVTANALNSKNAVNVTSSSTFTHVLTNLKSSGTGGDITTLQVANNSTSVNANALDISGGVDLVMLKSRRNALNVTANDLNDKNAVNVTSSSTDDHVLTKLTSTGASGVVNTLQVQNDSTDATASALDISGGVDLAMLNDDRNALNITANDLDNKNALNVTSSSGNGFVLASLTATGTGASTIMELHTNHDHTDAKALDISGGVDLVMLSTKRNAFNVTANELNAKNAVNVTSSSTEDHVLTKLTSTGASGVVNTLQLQNDSTDATANALDISGALDLVMLKTTRNAFNVTANELNAKNAVNVTSSSTDDHVLTKLTSTGASGVVNTLQLQNDSTDATANALDISGGVDLVMLKTTRNALNVTANELNAKNAVNVTSSSTDDHVLTKLTSTGASGVVNTLQLQNDSTDATANALDISGALDLVMLKTTRNAFNVTANELNAKNAVNVTSSSTDDHVLTKLTSTGASGVVNTLQLQNDSTDATANALDISGGVDLVMLKTTRNAFNVTANELNAKNAVNVTSSSTDDHVLTKLTSTGASGVVNTLQLQNDSTDATANALDISGGVDLVMLKTTRNAFNVTANELNAKNAVNVTSSSTDDHVLTKLTSTGASGVVNTLQLQNDSTDATANALDISGGVDLVMLKTTRNAFNVTANELNAKNAVNVTSSSTDDHVLTKLTSTGASGVVIHCSSRMTLPMLLPTH